VSDWVGVRSGLCPIRSVSDRECVRSGLCPIGKCHRVRSGMCIIGTIPLARVVADPSFVLDISKLNTNLPITRIFLSNIQEDTRDAPYLSPRTLPPSYTPVYEVEPDSNPPSDPQLLSPPPFPLNELSDSPPPSFPTLPPPIYSSINPSDPRIAKFLSIFYPEYTDPIAPGSFTLEPGPIHIPSLKDFLSTAPPNIFVPCLTPFTDKPIAFPIKYLRESYPPESNYSPNFD